MRGSAKLFKMHSGFFLALVVLLLSSCATVPLTGRRQISLLPESMLINMALTSYQDFMVQHPALPDTDHRVISVRRVGNRIGEAVNRYLTESNQGYRVEGFQWQFNVVEDETVNAWAMPGGKIMFYTGILPLTQNDDGIAVVMSHEIAHVVARHGNERMSQQLLLTMGAIGLEVALSESPEETRDIFLTSYGIGSQLGFLAYSRQHEYEADKLGMIFMAMAGYNPEVAVSFWERMLARSGGAEPPQFLSTHPATASRVRAAREFVPEAMKFFKPH